MIPGGFWLPDPVARRFPVDLTGRVHQKGVLFWMILYNPDGVQRYRPVTWRHRWQPGPPPPLEYERSNQKTYPPEPTIFWRRWRMGPAISPRSRRRIRPSESGRLIRPTRPSCKQRSVLPVHSRAQCICPGSGLERQCNDSILLLAQ